MSRWITIVFLCLSVLAPLGAAVTVEDLCQGIDPNRLRHCIDLSYNLDPHAEEAVERLVADYPELPAPRLIKSSRLYWLQEYAGVDKPLKQSFYEAAKESLEVAKRYAKKNNSDLAARYFLGMAEFSLARFHIEEGNWLRGLLKTRSGMSNIRWALKRSPDFHDAKLPVGLANCYLSDAPAYLKPFASLFRYKGDMDRGLALLEEAKAGGFYSRYEGASYLADVHWGIREAFTDAKAEMAFLVEAFPENLMFQRNLACLEQRTDQSGQALIRLDTIVYQKRLEDYPQLYLDVLIRLGRLRVDFGAYELALEHGMAAERVARRYKDFEAGVASALYIQGKSLIELDRIAEGRVALERIRKGANPRVYKLAQETLHAADTQP